MLSWNLMRKLTPRAKKPSSTVAIWLRLRCLQNRGAFLKLRSPQVSCGPFHAISQEGNLRSFPGKASNHVTKPGTRRFVQRAYRLQSQSSFLRAFRWHPESGHVSQTWHSSQVLVNKTTTGNWLMSCYEAIRFLLDLCKHTHCQEHNNTHLLRVSKFWRDQVQRKIQRPQYCLWK